MREEEECTQQNPIAQYKLAGVELKKFNKKEIVTCH